MAADIFNLSDYRQPPPKDPMLAFVEEGFAATKHAARKTAVTCLKTFYKNEYEAATSEQRALATGILMELMLDVSLTEIREKIERVRVQLRS